MTIPTPPAYTFAKLVAETAAPGRNVHRDRRGSHGGDRGTGDAHAGWGRHEPETGFTASDTPPSADDRLAREVHDTVAQVLAAMMLRMDTIHGLLERGRVAEADAEVERLRAAADRAYAHVRQAIAGLRARSGADACPPHNHRAAAPPAALLRGAAERSQW
jgi:hypothetical protein